MQALWLKSQGLPNFILEIRLPQEIVKTLGISPTTLRSDFRFSSMKFGDLFGEGRVEALKRFGCQGQRNLRRERKDEMIVNLEANPPATDKEAQAQIQTVTGYHEGVGRDDRTYLHQCRLGLCIVGEVA
jgi:hypothetical protein